MGACSTNCFAGCARKGNCATRHLQHTMVSRKLCYLLAHVWDLDGVLSHVQYVIPYRCPSNLCSHLSTTWTSQARFARPSGVTSTSDGAAYISDVASCRLRRVAPTIKFVAAPATCNTTLLEVLRPSGCSSYEPPQGGDGLLVSALSGYIWYNSWRNLTSLAEGTGDSATAVAAAAAAEVAGGYGEDYTSVAGRVVRQCVGFPPPDRLDRAVEERDTLVIDDGLREVFEDTGVGTTIRLTCPTSCVDGIGVRGGRGVVRGSPDFYTDDSAVCMAAVHMGLMTTNTMASHSLEVDGESEPVVVIVVRLLPGNATAAARGGSTANNITASDAPANWGRGFALKLASRAEVTAQTISGIPAGALGEGCGDAVDGQPPQETVFGRPAGIDAWHWGSLTDEASFKEAGVSGQMAQGSHEKQR